MPKPSRLAVAVSFVTLALAMSATAQPAPAAQPSPQLPMRAYVPSTISPEAAAIYARYRAFVLAPRPGPPKTLADFDALYQGAEKRGLAASEARLKVLQPTVIERHFTGVQAFEVRPKGWKNDGTVIIHVHGGGFVTGSARSSLGEAADIATATGRRVFTVEYTVAPRGNWRMATDQVMAVYKGLLGQGVKAKRIGMTGGSAGATIVAATTLKIRDRGLPMPAALILMCPMSDFTDGEDTRVTLAEADPALYMPQVRPGLDAYADPADQKNPYVSPVYGDFSKGYPPTLIQGGTKEFLLSDMVRLHRAIKRGGGISDLEIYEGMPHGFMGLMPDAPEGREARAEEVAFWKRYLPAARR
ncbi:MAG TPA: alpha/beta hydrolase [Caulobacteraceae bacterium]|jgi:acetyl esterase/lipase